MITKRSFFKRVASAVAIIALAPEIAFRSKLAIPFSPAYLKLVLCERMRSGLIANLNESRIYDPHPDQ